MINQLTIIGLGLIGGSVAHAIKNKSFCKKIVAVDSNHDSLKKAQQLNVIDAYTTDIASAVQHADLILIATPINMVEKIFLELKPAITSDIIITDVSSVKSFIINSAKKILGTQCNQFVPGHPIAGSEKSGFEAAIADLFKERSVILTPQPENSAAAIEIVTQLWQATGARVINLSADLHDSILAATSHTPQMLAYTFMNSIAEHSNFPEILKYTGTGFRDFTRIAASNPVLWSDICLANTEPILKELKRFENHLTQLQQALKKSDRKLLFEIFLQAQQAKIKNV